MHADPVWRDAHMPGLLKGQKVSAQPEIRKKASDKIRGRPQTALLTAQGPNHAMAIDYCLRSPEGVIYTGRNLRDFVRTHEFLFAADDVIWRAVKYKTPSKVIKAIKTPELHCRASHGLANMFGQHKNVRHSWKGWTRVGVSALAA